MHTDENGVAHPRRNRHLAERFEGLLGVIMVVAIAILAVGLIWGIMSTGSDAPSWMK